MGPRFAALRTSQPHNPTLGFGLSVQDGICTKSPIDTTTAVTPLPQAVKAECHSSPTRVVETPERGGGNTANTWF